MDRTKKAETAGYHSSLRFLSENAPFKGESPHFTEATGVARTSSTFRKTVNTKMGTTSSRKTWDRPLTENRKLMWT